MLPKEESPFIAPNYLYFGQGIRVSDFGFEVLEQEPEIFVNLPLRNAEHEIFELSFTSFCSNPELIWQGTPVDENNKPTGKCLSLRTTEPNCFKLAFKIAPNTKAIKLDPSHVDCIVNLTNISIAPNNGSFCIEDDLKSSQKRHRAIVCFPIIDWEYRKQRPHHIMRKLAESGNHIVYLSTRLYGFHHDQAVFQNVEDRITKVTLPGNFRLNLYKDTLTTRSINQAYQALLKFLLERAFDDVVLICHLPFWLPLALKLREERGYPIIYDCMDDHSGFENNNQAMLNLEHALCEESNLLITSSKLLYEQKSKLNSNCALIRNAGDVNHFSKTPENYPDNISQLNKPIIGYFGAIAEWFDIEAIKAAASAHPEWSLVLIGHYEESTSIEFSGYNNITLLGELDYQVLPQYLYSFDVCLIPFKRIPLTEATNPVKIYEYFASGKPVISRRLPEVEIFSDITYLYDTPEDFVNKIEEALLETSTDTKVEKRRKIARTNTWAARGELFEKLIDELEKKVSIVIVSFEALPFLRNCINSILNNTEYLNYEIIIVDNASSEPVIMYLKELEKVCAKVKVIYNNSNVGFAAANNQGIKAAAINSEYFILLNNDTVVPSGWLSRLVYYASRPEIGMVGPVTNNIGNEAQIHTSYQSMEEMGRVSWGLRNQFQGEIFDIKVLAMFCVAFRKEVLEKVGLLDEDFGIGMFEDDDYAQRIRAAGLRVVCAEDVFIHHYGSISFKQLKKDNYDKIFAKNKEIYEKKWGPWIPHTYR